MLQFQGIGPGVLSKYILSVCFVLCNCIGEDVLFSLNVEECKMRRLLLFLASVVLLGADIIPLSFILIFFFFYKECLALGVQSTWNRL